MNKQISKLMAGFVLSILLVPQIAKCQFSIGGTINYTSYLGGSSIHTPGIGLQGTYALGDDDAGVRFTFLYNFEAKEEEYTYVTAMSSSTSPTQLEVPLTTKTGVMMFNLDYKKYFGDGDLDDGGIYGVVGLGLTMATSKYEMGTYDQTLYYAGFDPNTSESTSQFHIRAFLGYEHALDNLKLFGEAGLGLSANKSGETDIEVTLPSYFNFNVGVRIPIGD